METILYFPRNQRVETMSSGKLANTATELGFHLQVGEITASIEQAKSFIKFWNPVGCIVNNDNLPIKIFNGIPSVFCHRDPKSLPSGSVLFSYDETAVAQMAVRELLRLNLASYCFVPDPSNEYWNQMRKSEFFKAMEINFKLKCSSVCPIRNKSKAALQSNIAQWLCRLPKPIGVFAANDATARIVADACIHARLDIPNEVALIGVDNIPMFCERPDISISSITFDANISSIQLLALKDAISHANLTIKVVSIPPKGVIRRASTMYFSRTDHEVQTAVELIRRDACNGLTAQDVVRTFTCSRRMVETRFRAATGHSILDEIRTARLNRAKELIAEGQLKSSEIATRCGYRSYSSIFRLLNGKGV